MEVIHLPQNWVCVLDRGFSKETLLKYNNNHIYAGMTSWEELTNTNMQVGKIRAHVWTQDKSSAKGLIQSEKSGPSKKNIFKPIDLTQRKLTRSNSEPRMNFPDADNSTAVYFRQPDGSMCFWGLWHPILPTISNVLEDFKHSLCSPNPQVPDLLGEPSTWPRDSHSSQVRFHSIAPVRYAHIKYCNGILAFQQEAILL